MIQSNQTRKTQEQICEEILKYNNENNCQAIQYVIHEYLDDNQDTEKVADLSFIIKFAEEKEKTNLFVRWLEDGQYYLAAILAKHNAVKKEHLSKDKAYNCFFDNLKKQLDSINKSQRTEKMLYPTNIANFNELLTNIIKLKILKFGDCIDGWVNLIKSAENSQTKKILTDFILSQDDEKKISNLQILVDEKKYEQDIIKIIELRIIYAYDIAVINSDCLTVKLLESAFDTNNLFPTDLELLRKIAKDGDFLWPLIDNAFYNHRRESAPKEVKEDIEKLISIKMKFAKKIINQLLPSRLDEAHVSLNSFTALMCGNSLELLCLLISGHSVAISKEFALKDIEISGQKSGETTKICLIRLLIDNSKTDDLAKIIQDQVITPLAFANAQKFEELKYLLENGFFTNESKFKNNVYENGTQILKQISKFKYDDKDGKLHNLLVEKGMIPSKELSRDDSSLINFEKDQLLKNDQKEAEVPEYSFWNPIGWAQYLKHKFLNNESMLWRIVVEKKDYIDFLNTVELHKKNRIPLYPYSILAPATLDEPVIHKILLEDGESFAATNLDSFSVLIFLKKYSLAMKLIEFGGIITRELLQTNYYTNSKESDNKEGEMVKSCTPIDILKQSKKDISIVEDLSDAIANSDIGPLILCMAKNELLIASDYMELLGVSELIKCIERNELSYKYLLINNYNNECSLQIVKVEDLNALVIAGHIYVEDFIKYKVYTSLNNYLNNYLKNQEVNVKIEQVYRTKNGNDILSCLLNDYLATDNLQDIIFSIISLLVTKKLLSNKDVSDQVVKDLINSDKTQRANKLIELLMENGLYLSPQIFIANNKTKMDALQVIVLPEYTEKQYKIIKYYLLRKDVFVEHLIEKRAFALLLVLLQKEQSLSLENMFRNLDSGSYIKGILNYLEEEKKLDVNSSQYKVAKELINRNLIAVLTYKTANIFANSQCLAELSILITNDKILRDHIFKEGERPHILEQLIANNKISDIKDLVVKKQVFISHFVKHDLFDGLATCLQNDVFTQQEQVYEQPKDYESNENILFKLAVNLNHEKKLEVQNKKMVVDLLIQKELITKIPHFIVAELLREKKSTQAMHGIKNLIDLCLDVFVRKQFFLAETKKVEIKKTGIQKNVQNTSGIKQKLVQCKYQTGFRKEKLINENFILMRLIKDSAIVYIEKLLVTGKVTISDLILLQEYSVVSDLLNSVKVNDFWLDVEKDHANLNAKFAFELVGNGNSKIELLKKFIEKKLFKKISDTQFQKLYADSTLIPLRSIFSNPDIARYCEKLSNASISLIFAQQLIRHEIIDNLITKGMAETIWSQENVRALVASDYEFKGKLINILIANKQLPVLNNDTLICFVVKNFFDYIFNKDQKFLVEIDPIAPVSLQKLFVPQHVDIIKALIQKKLLKNVPIQIIVGALEDARKEVNVKNSPDYIEKVKETIELIIQSCLLTGKNIKNICLTNTLLGHLIPEDMYFLINAILIFHLQNFNVTSIEGKTEVDSKSNVTITEQKPELSFTNIEDLQGKIDRSLEVLNNETMLGFALSTKLSDDDLENLFGMLKAFGKLDEPEQYLKSEFVNKRRTLAILCKEKQSGIKQKEVEKFQPYFSSFKRKEEKLLAKIKEEELSFIPEHDEEEKGEVDSKQQYKPELPLQ